MIDCLQVLMYLDGDLPEEAIQQEMRLAVSGIAGMRWKGLAVCWCLEHKNARRSRQCPACAMQCNAHSMPKVCELLPSSLLQGKPAEEVESVSRLFTEVQRTVDAKQLKPMVRTQYQRTAFQIPFDQSVRIRWVWGSALWGCKLMLDAVRCLGGPVPSTPSPLLTGALHSISVLVQPGHQRVHDQGEPGGGAYNRIGWQASALGPVAGAFA